MNMINEKLPERYQLISVISSGGFGDIVAVRDKVLGADIALKVLNKFSKKSARTFRSEFTHLSAINHPNLVRVFDYGLLQSGKPYFTMELIRGKDLRAFFEQQKNLQHLQDIISQSLQALKYLHSKGILHGDIKPENIMVTSDNKIKLLDFGLVVRIGANRSKISGTLGYVSPETLKNGVYTESSDLYALGVSLIESILRRKVQLENQSLYEELCNKLSSIGLQNASSISSFILSLCSPDREMRPENTEQAILSFEISSIFKPKWSKIDFKNAFVGRKKELHRAEEFLRREYDKRLLIIEGVLGSGKKSFANQIKSEAQVNGFITIELDALEGILSPIWDIFELIAQYFEKKESRKIKTRLEYIYKTFKQDSSDIVAGRLSENYRIDLYINLAKLLVSCSSHNPLLIILKNIESFDEDFLEFIIQLEQVLYVDSVDSVLLVCTLNSEKMLDGTNQVNEIIKHELTDRINLGSLSKSEIKYLVRQVFNEDIFLDKEIEFIREKTQGLPMLVIELLKQLVSKSLLAYDGESWIRQNNIHVKIQMLSSISSMFIDKWKPLTRYEKQLLQIIAFYDSKIRMKALAKLTSINPQLLNKLSQLGILSVDGEYIDFINPMYKEYIKKNTSSLTRKKINSLIALALVSSKESNIIRIAKYFLESDSIDMAYKYGHSAAKKLMSRNNLFLAYDYLIKLSRILKKANRPDELSKTFILLAELEELFGRLEEAIHQYKFIIENCDDDKLRTIALIKLGNLEYTKKGNLKRSHILYLMAYKHAVEANDKKLIALSLTGLSESMKGIKKSNSLIKAARIAKSADIDTYSVVISKLLFYYWSLGDIKTANKYLLEAINIADNLSHTNRLHIYHAIWVLKFYTSDYQFILDYFGKIYRKKAEHLSFMEKARLAEMYAGVYYALAKYNKMIPLIKETIKIFNMQKAYYSMIIAKNNLLIAYKELADYSRCLSTIDDIQVLRNSIKIRHYYSTNIAIEAKVYSLLGIHYKDKYIERIALCRYIIHKENSPIFIGHYYLALLDNNYLSLHFKRGLKNAEKALSFFRKVESRDDTCECLLKKAMLLCELDEARKAWSYIKEALEIYEAIHCEYLRPRLLLAKGMVERINGKEEAIESFREALKTSKRQMTREQTWQIQRELALLWKGKGHLKRALKYYKDAVETIKQITESIPTEEIKLSYLDVPIRRRVFEEIKELKKQIVD